MLALFLGFWVLIYFIDQRQGFSRYNIEVGLFQFIARTEKLTHLIDAIAKGIRPVWVAYSFLGIILGVAAMAITTSNFLFVGRMLFDEPSATTGVQIVIPGVTLPLTYSLIALISVILVHEFSHGIIARINGIKLKSVGAGIFAVLPFAFVEPDEDSMKESTPLARVKVYSAGSMANFTLAFVALIILFGLVVPSLSGSGLSIASVESDQPGGIAGLEKGMVLEGIDYMDKSYVINDYDDFTAIMNITTPGADMVVYTDQGTFSFQLGQHPQGDVGYIGISTYDRSVFRDVNPLLAFLYSPLVLGIDVAVFPDSFSTPVWFLIDCIKYIFFLNVGIGLFNMLPIGPLDGGRVFREFTDKIFNKRLSSVISNSVSVIIGFLILASLVFPYLF